jgi:uncharacterized Zn finger protein
MPISWTSEQIIALAPDDPSAKAGHGLASVSKWETIGCDEHAVWGECRGSGKNPYQVSIDLSEPAFKCSCPSRKFPCKHGLGLFLLYAGNQVKPAASPPGFCAEWLEKRAAAQDRKKEKSETEPTPEESAKREKAREKRHSERETKVAAGLQELELWLTDLIRQGLAGAQSQPTEYWEKMARRLIDAQAPNVARLVREMSGAFYQTNGRGKSRTENLLERIGKVYLIAESYKRIADLPAPTQADIRAAVGFSAKENEMQNAETIRDDWQTLGVRVSDEDKLRVQRVWLYGEKSGREALILNFAFQNQPLDASFAAGTKFTGKLAFYPSNFPQRAVLQER